MINQHQFQQSARHFRSGRISLSEFQSRVFAGTETKPHETKSAAVPAPASPTGVTLDLQRADRCGWSEVIIGAGQSVETLIDILNQLKTAGHPALVVRVSDQTGEELANQITDGHYEAACKTFIRGTYDQKKTFGGEIAVVASGESDLSILEEVCSTMRWMGANVNRIEGVADPEHLTPHLETLKSASAIVVIAGTKGEVLNVVASHAGCPVFAVPTSAAHGGKPDRIAAFVEMVNKSATNVAMVNIDAGYKAGYLAAMVAAKQ